VRFGTPDGAIVKEDWGFYQMIGIFDWVFLDIIPRHKGQRGRVPDLSSARVKAKATSNLRMSSESVRGWPCLLNTEFG